MLAVTGVTMFGLYFSHSFASVAAWLVVSGVFSTGIIPACISAFSESVEEENRFLATSIAESGVNIGAFLGTPYIALIEAFGGSADTAMFISPIIMLILGFVTLRFYKKTPRCKFALRLSGAALTGRMRIHYTDEIRASGELYALFFALAAGVLISLMAVFQRQADC